MIPLSILDLSVVTTGTRPAAALRNSIDLARHADALGYVRYWLAEHHNLSSVASPAPDIMIGQIAAVTNRIRVGSGGVMLPNPRTNGGRAFQDAGALFPGRIDLGLGAPGTDGATAYALRTRSIGEGRRLLERLQTGLVGDPRFSADHPSKMWWRCPTTRRCRRSGCSGSSDYVRACRQGRHGFRVCASFLARSAIRSDDNYRAHFKPSAWRATPLAFSPSPRSRPGDAEAEHLIVVDLNRCAGSRPVPAAAERRGGALSYTDSERASIARNPARLFVGSPTT
jgi:luciferase family oxidoreductase group 1